MSVTVERFGVLKSGEEVERYVLTGSGGLTVKLITYGAAVQAVLFQGKDVVLGFDDLKGYEENNTSYQGATIGRYGNRIADGRFSLNGSEYLLACNENGRGHLHGGNKGFDKCIWEAEIVSDGAEPAVRFFKLSPDGEEGYPGNLQVRVTMTVTKENALQIEYQAESDADTVINLTNHSYFNLNGVDGGDILDTVLTLRADAITPVNAALIPDGSYLSVEGTAFDFRQPKAIGRDINDTHPQMLLGGGYDHNFMLLAPEEHRLFHAATAVSPKSGIRLDCYTDQPALQLYTSNALSETSGKNGTPLYPRQGFCLETQHVPDSPNHSAYPSTLLKAGEVFASVTIFQFSAEQ